MEAGIFEMNKETKLMRVQCDCGVVMKTRYITRFYPDWIINTCPRHGYQFIHKLPMRWDSLSHADMRGILNGRGFWENVPEKCGFQSSRHVMWLLADHELVSFIGLLKRHEDSHEQKILEQKNSEARKKAEEENKLKLVAADFSFQREPVSDEAFFGAARRVSCQAIPVDEPASGHRIYRSSRAGITRELKQYYGSPQMAGAW